MHWVGQEYPQSKEPAAHIRQYKEILKKYNNVSDFSKVPLQVSFDATAVTGRFQSRKLQSRCSDNVDRIIYGVTTPSGPLQKTLINVETCEGRNHVAQDKSCICINGMENTLDLVEEGAISRAKSYMSIVLLALIPDSRPYCVGMYSVTKGTYSFALSTAHREGTATIDPPTIDPPTIDPPTIDPPTIDPLCNYTGVNCREI